jgi:hypothetical protein
MIGERKLNLLQVQEIKKLLKDGYPLKEIAEQFGVTRQLIWYISKGKRWGVHKYVISQRDEQILLPSFKEELKGGGILYTKACEIIGPVYKLYIVMSFIDGQPMKGQMTHMCENIPTYDDVLIIHGRNKNFEI